MKQDWKKLLALAGGKTFRIRKIHLPSEDISIEGDFDLPPLARLNGDDQLFVSAFIQTHGSIKQMEKIFGISYPTVKNRLNLISGQLDLIDVSVDVRQGASQVIEKLSRGDISVDEAVEELK